MVAALKKDDVTQPMRGPSGFHILKLVDTRDASAEIVREYHARHILVRATELVSSDDALASARNIRDRAVAGEDFSKLAKEFSEDPTTANLGGDMGWFEIGAYGTRVGEVLGTLSDNEIAQPFQTEVGWHVLQRLGVRDADRTQDRVRQQARETVRNRKAEEEYDAFLRQIRGEAYIENRLAGASDTAAASSS
jgi:peptidyl-prolyl cis-trans isomerase SurA